MILSCHIVQPLRLCVLVVLIFSGAAGRCLADSDPADQPPPAVSSPASVPASSPASSPASMPASGPVTEQLPAMMKLQQIPPAFTWPEPATESTGVDPQAMALYLKARAQYRQSEIAEALKLLEEVLARQSDNFDAHKLIGTIYFLSRQWSTAREHLTEALQKAPTDVSCLYMLGSLALQSDDSDQALPLLRLSVLASERVDFRSADAVLGRFLLAKLLAAKGYITAAAEQHEQLLIDLQELDDAGLIRDTRLRQITKLHRPGIYMTLATLYRRLERYSDAISVYNRLLELRPGYRPAEIAMTGALLEAGQAGQAYEKAVKLIADEPSDPDIQRLFREACNSYGKGHWLEHLATLYTTQPDNINLGLAAAQLAAQHGRDELAQQSLQQVLARDPGNLAASWLLIRLYISQGRLEQAVDLSLEAIRQKPNSSAAAFSHAVTGNLDPVAASLMLEAINRLSGDRDFAWHYLSAVTALAAEQFEAAENDLLRSLQLKGNFKAAYLALSRLYMQLHDWESAKSTVERATDTGLTGSALNSILGQALGQLGQDQRAEQILSEVLGSAPGDVEARLTLANIYLRDGKASEALALMRQVLQLSIPNAQLLDRLIRMLVRSQAWPGAQQVLEAYRDRIGADASYELLEAMLDYYRTGRADHYQQRLEKLMQLVDHPIQVEADLIQLHFDRGSYRQVAQLATETLSRFAPHQVSHRLYQQILQAQAISYWRLLEYDLAQAIWEQMISTWPARTSYRLALAAMYLDAQMLDEARSTLNDLLAGQLDRRIKMRCRRQLVRAMLISGQWSQAAQKVQAYLQESPDDQAEGETEAEKQELQALLVNCYLWDQQYSQAISLINQYLQREKSQLAWRGQLIGVMIEARQLDKAWELLNLWLGQEQDGLARAQLSSMQVQVHTAADRHRQAFELVEQLLREDTAQTVLVRQTLQEQMVMILQTMGKYLQAGELIEQHRREAQTDAAKRNWDQVMINYYFNTSQGSQARKLLGRIVKAAPNLGWANNALGYSLISAGELDQAEQYIRKALTTDPGNLAFLDSLGWVYYHRGEFGEALEFLLMAYRAMPNASPVILDHLADAYWQLGDHRLAGRYWKISIQQAQKADPQFLEPDMPARTIQKLQALEQAQHVPVTPPIGLIPAPATSTAPAN